MRAGPGLGSEKLAAFLAVRDAQKAKEFYGGTLGLRLVSEDGRALVFDANGTRLRVQAGVIHEMSQAKYTVLGWQVADIASTVRALQKRGVKFEIVSGVKQDELGIWKAPDGTQVAWFKDPDGHILSLDQQP